MISQLATQLNSMRGRLKAQKKRTGAAVERIQELATRDELSRLVQPTADHRQVLGEHAARSNQGVVKFWVSVLDLDHSKQVNDTWATMWVTVLRSFAQMAASVLRETDVWTLGGRVSCGDVVRAAARSSCGLERLRPKLADAQVERNGAAFADHVVLGGVWLPIPSTLRSNRPLSEQTRRCTRPRPMAQPNRHGARTGSQTEQLRRHRDRDHGGLPCLRCRQPSRATYKPTGWLVRQALFSQAPAELYMFRL